MGFEQRKKWEQSCLEMHIYQAGARCVCVHRQVSPSFEVEVRSLSMQY